MWRPILLIALIITILILAHALGASEKLGALREWIQSLGPLGPAAFVGLYVLGVVVGIPGSALTVAAGGLFGSFLGIILVSFASTLGASFSFLIARYFARDAIANRLSRREKFKRLDGMIEAHGAMIVVITRLIPIFPFNFLNYGFGLTKIPFWTYLFWSWLCMLPGTILYVVGVDALLQFFIQRKVPWILVGVITGMGVLLVILIKLARSKIKDYE
jgi:uncharacterized membrane protein YdjX (TVP38/TMEM64 family)